jgi:predicted nucleic acid-binding protein
MQTIMPTKTDLFVDTSGWAYYLDRQDPLFPRVAALVRSAVTQKRHLVTTNYIIAELVALLSNRYHLPRQQVIKAINALKIDEAVEIVHVDQSTDSEAWGLLEVRPDKEWSLVDASSFVVMKRFSMTQALTTDHHFTQAGFIRLPSL